MGVKIKATSTLQFARFVNIDGVECWEMPELPTIGSDETDTEHEVDMSDRIDRISRRAYGAADWIRYIALANDIDLYPNGLRPGSKLSIPSPTRLAEIIKTATRKKEGR